MTKIPDHVGIIGDLFYGDGADQQPTHLWNGWRWIAFSEFAEGPIPGSEAIPADMPNAKIEEGNGALPYNLQTFNSLVAANTAMQTEISSLNEKIGLLEQQRNSFAAGLEHAQAHEERYVTQIADLQKLDREQRAQMKDMLERERNANNDLANSRAEISRWREKLARAMGYIDRVQDLEMPFDPSVPQATAANIEPRRRGPRMDPDPRSARELWDYAVR